MHKHICAVVVAIYFVTILPLKCQDINNEDKVNQEDLDDKEDGSEADPTLPKPPLPYALSSTYLTHLAQTEQEVYKEIKSYVDSLKERLEIAEAYLKDYEDSSIKGTAHLPENADGPQKAIEVSSNPLMTYRMIRRFSLDVPELTAHVDEFLEEDLIDRLNELRGLNGFPGMNDHMDALEAILRLQYTYDLNPDDLARGRVKDVETNVGLTPRQCYTFAAHATKAEYYTLALQWLHTTGAKIKEENDTTVGLDNVANLQTTLIEKHDQDFDQNSYNLFMYADKLSSGPNVLTVKERDMAKYREEPNTSSMHYTFLALCNGEDLMTPQERSKLYCWYERKNNPYFILFPLKMELLNKEPYLVQIYDIVSDAWIKDMQREAIPWLERAPIANYSNKDTLRTAIYAWLEDHHIPETPISRRVELLFDLKVRGMNASEYLQVAAYAMGGHVGTHVDNMGTGNPEIDENIPTIKWKGDRMSTFLVYLNDVVKGGLTAFPLLGTHVKPIKGSAVYWHTSLRNGNIDVRMLHGACPIVLGHKWIATKWTHSKENFLKRPCALDPNL